jgi:TonB family protein
MSYHSMIVTKLCCSVACACAILALLTSGCGHRLLSVIRMTAPCYPLEARLNNIQGVVSVTVNIAKDGTVASANGIGASSILVAAAEANAKQWIFGPVPARAQFPLQQQITYKFKLEGRAMYIAVDPTIVTDLPTGVEIVGRPIAAEKTTLIHPAQ